MGRALRGEAAMSLLLAVGRTDAGAVPTAYHAVRRWAACCEHRAEGAGPHICMVAVISRSQLGISSRQSARISTWRPVAPAHENTGILGISCWRQSSIDTVLGYLCPATAVERSSHTAFARAPKRTPKRTRKRTRERPRKTTHPTHPTHEENCHDPDPTHPGSHRF